MGNFCEGGQHCKLENDLILEKNVKGWRNGNGWRFIYIIHALKEEAKDPDEESGVEDD